VEELDETIEEGFWGIMTQVFNVFFDYPLLTFASLVAMVWLFPKCEQARRRLIWLLLLPSIWVFVGFWGSYFVHGRRINPFWVDWPIIAAIPLAAILCVVFIIRMKNGRIFTAIFCIFNLIIIALTSFVSAMSTSGDWL
jgi:hypothetical protein